MSSGTAQSEAGYGVFAKTLHWLVFVLLAAQYAVGSIMPHIGGRTLNEGWVSWHLSIGAAIMFVILVRVVWRIAWPVALLSTMTVWQRRLAAATHVALYALVIVMTVLGWAAANFRGWTVMLFGIIPLPALAPKGARWAHEAGDIHNVLVYVLLGVIALHVAAVAYHQLIRRDGLLTRMLPAKA